MHAQSEVLSWEHCIAPYDAAKDVMSLHNLCLFTILPKIDHTSILLERHFIHLCTLLCKLTISLTDDKCVIHSKNVKKYSFLLRRFEGFFFLFCLEIGKLNKRVVNRHFSALHPLLVGYETLN
jgi:hypothetical protein